MERFFFEVPGIRREQDAVDYVNEFREYGSEINGCGGLHRFLDNYEGWLAKLNEDLKNAETPEAYQNILSDIRAINAEMEAFTGKTMERPAFQSLLNKLTAQDTLVVTKLDRFARTAIDGVQTVRNLFERGVRVHILNMGLIYKYVFHLPIHLRRFRHPARGGDGLRLPRHRLRHPRHPRGVW